MKNRYLILSLVAVSLLFAPLFLSSKKKSEETPSGEIPPPSPETPSKIERIWSSPILIDEKPVQVTEKREKSRGGIISGRVTDQNGRSIPGVNVTCIDKEGKTIAQITTDENGNYLFQDVEKGEYAIQVDLSGFSTPVQIKFADHTELPVKPGGLKLFETHQEITTGSYIYSFWEKVRGATAYTCEIYAEGMDNALFSYPDIKQNFCEFGDLEENTRYEVRVYSRNENGYSEEYASALLQTSNKPPIPPFGLAVTYAKNNRVDLLWHSAPEVGLKGFVLQIKKDKGEYRFFNPEGFATDREGAQIIPFSGAGLARFSISVDANGQPILENSIPYSFRVFALDQDGSMSKPSAAVSGIVLEDTIPPLPPKNVRYEFVGESRLRISWDTDDRDIRKFVIYYGVEKNRWDGVVSTSKRSYDLLIDREKLHNKELLVSIIAVDRAGNESGYKPYVKKTTVEKNESVSEDIVLTERNIYKDYSVAIRPPPPRKAKTPKPEPSSPPKTRIYGYSVLRSKGYVIGKGETANLTGKIYIPEKTFIQVMSGGTLNVRDARIGPEDDTWGGIQYQEGSAGKILNTELLRAKTAVSIINSEGGVQLFNVDAVESREAGVQVKNSRVEISQLSARDGVIGLYIESSRVNVSSSIFEGNEKGILAKNHNLTIVDSHFLNNRVYGLRVYGGAKISRCTFRENLAGAVIDAGLGSSQLLDCTIELNRMDGVVIYTSNTSIRGNVISSNGRNGIYLKEGSNPDIVRNDILSNRDYAIVGGGKVVNCYIAFNNGSTYIDDTGERGRPDNVFSSSSSGVIKQILGVDYINQLAMSSVLR
jgi:parallel beta-helix repeat protein